MSKLKLIATAALLSFSISTANAANIVEIAASTGKFETLIAAAKAAGLGCILIKSSQISY